jgi:hypothetical protein
MQCNSRYWKASILIFLGVLSVGQADAEDQSACGAIMCLYGQMQGKGGGAPCRPYLEKYFGIRRFDDDGFDGRKTSRARDEFLKGCKSSRSEDKNAVNSVFGAVRNF